MDCKLYYDTLGKTGISERELKRFEKTLPYVMRKGSLCDVGCGEGYWLEYLNQNTELNLFGIEVSTERLKPTKENTNNKIKFINADIRNLPFYDDEIDQITALEILEHIPEWEKGLEELIRVASKRVIVSVPYNEKLKYESCPECGEKAYLYGHLHSFREEDFKKLNLKGKIEFIKIPHALDLSYYLFRRLNSEKDFNKNRKLTICPECYIEIPYRKITKIKRAEERIFKLITKTPEHLIIKIDK